MVIESKEKEKEFGAKKEMKKMNLNLNLYRNGKLPLWSPEDKLLKDCLLFGTIECEALIYTIEPLDFEHRG